MTYNVFHGHFLTRNEVAELIGCDASEVDHRTDLVVVHGAVPGNEIYPALQFDHDGIPTPAVEGLIDGLSPHLADVEIASFCTLPITQLGGRTPLDYLRAGGRVERAIEAAQAA